MSANPSPSTPTPLHRCGNALVLVTLLLYGAACSQPSDLYVERGLEPLGAVDLTSLDDETRSAIEAQQKAVEVLLADDSVSVRELAEGLGELAVRLGRSGYWEKARLSYANAATLEPEALRWKLGEIMMRGGAAIANNDWVGADSAYQEILQQDPGNLAAYRGLALARRETGDLAGAYDVVRAGLDVAPPEGEEYSASDLRERAALFVHLGDLEFTRGADEEGVAAFASSLQLDNRQAQLLPKIGDALVRLGRLEAALTQFERYLEVAPNDVAVRERYATALVNLGEMDRAVAEFERALELSAKDLGLALRYAAALEYLGRGEEAAAVRSRVRQEASEPEDRSQLALYDGDQKLRQSQPSDAEALFRRALELTPDSAAARLRLSRALGQQGRWDEAAEELQTILDANERNPEAQRALVMVLVLGKRYDRARSQLQAALQQYPRDLELALTQVRLLSTVPDPAVADPPLALAIAQRAYEAHQNESTLEALALALAANGYHDKAVEAQQVLIEGTQQKALAPLDEARLVTYQKKEAWIARVPEEILVDLGI